MLPTDPAGEREVWGLDVRNPLEASCGPIDAFGAHVPTHLVRLLDPWVPPGGDEIGRLVVRESHATFEVSRYRFDGFEGIFHPIGENWILWEPGGTALWLTAAGSDHESWVYGRFLLRHLFVSELVPRGFSPVHAVIAAAHGGDRGVLIAGPSASGKTRLMNRLLERGLLEECLDDDCPVISAGPVATCLVPLQREFRRARSVPIGAIVLLDESVGTFRVPGSSEVVSFCASLTTSWPVSWLPPALPPVAPDRSLGDVPAISVRHRCADDRQALEGLSDFLNSALE